MLVKSQVWLSSERWRRMVVTISVWKLSRLLNRWKVAIYTVYHTIGYIWRRKIAVSQEGGRSLECDPPGRRREGEGGVHEGWAYTWNTLGYRLHAWPCVQYKLGSICILLPACST